MTFYSAASNRKKGQVNTCEAKMDFVNQFPMFSCLNVEEKEQLAEMLEGKEKQRYSFIYESGESSDCIYFLADGLAKIACISHDGKEIIKELIHPLAMFGELGLVGETQRKENAQILRQNALVYAVKAADFRQLMRNNYELSNRVMNYLGKRLSAAEQRMESLVFKDARTRIVEFIKSSISDRGQKVGFEMLLKHSLTHQDIANITCTSRQTVTLVLNELRKSDQIYFNRGKILVRDMKTLS
jgi:CRP/FNR family transcriptional regulator, cyclic AMP receptor protein